MTKANQSKSDSVSLLHQQLRAKIYKFSKKHGITAFEAIGVLYHLATEFSTGALVDDGFLEGVGSRDGDEVAVDEPVSAQQEIDGLHARIKELMGENEFLDRGLNKMTRVAESLKEDNAILRDQFNSADRQAQAMRSALATALKP